LAEAARKKANELGLTISDYLAALIAQDTDLPQFSPQRIRPNRTEITDRPGCPGSTVWKRMTESTWRNEWPTFRTELVDETARCLANQRSALTDGELPGWTALTKAQQDNLTEIVAGVFFAQDQAMENLVKQGQSI
jgi:hypothetical protein